jgi:environmental stress-induced protein Ves
MSAGVTALRPADYRRMRWANGGGWTTELAREPGEGAFDWRISVAEVDEDCDFSPLSGIDRSIVVLTGAGMELRVADGPPVVLVAGGPPLAFPGDLATRCRLLGGPTRDFNVMTRRGAVSHTLAREVVDGSRVIARDQAGLVYVIAGELAVGELRLTAGDSLRITAVPGDSCTLRGAGELLWVRLGGPP